MAEINKSRLEDATKAVWNVIGPTYTGWPNIGERVQWCYRDQYKGALERCEAAARAALATADPGKAR